MGIWKSPLLYEDCMKPECIGKSNTNNLPAPTDLTENPYGEKKLWCNSKIGLNGTVRNCNRIRTMEADFWKRSSSSRKRGGADAQDTRWVCADPYSTTLYSRAIDRYLESISIIFCVFRRRPASLRDPEQSTHAAHVRLASCLASCAADHGCKNTSDTLYREYAWRIRQC